MTKEHKCKENDFDETIKYLIESDADNFYGSFRGEGWHISLDDNGTKITYCPFCGVKL